MPARRKTSPVICLAVLLFVCASNRLWQTTLCAGDYSVRSWGVDEGLPQSSVTDIVQTPDGYIWVGTLLSGISRFDGTQFLNFNPGGTNGLEHPGIRRLLVDSTGALWVNDYGNNLYRWRTDRFEAVGLHDVALGSLVAEGPGRRVFSTLAGELVEGWQGVSGAWRWERHKPPQATRNPHYVADKDGALWFQSPGARLSRFSQGRFELMPNPPGLERARVQTLARDEAGQIWVGTSDGLARWTGSAFATVAPPPAEPGFSVKSIIPAGPDSLWVEGNGRLRLLTNGQWTVEAAAWDGTRPPWSRVRLWRSDNAGGVWISLQEEGLAHLGADGTLSRITSADGLPSQLVQAFYPDREGTLWTGYHRGGLAQVRRRLFHPVARAEGLLDTVVTSVSEDAQGQIWIGTAGGTVARWSGGACTNFALPLHGSSCQDVVLHGAPDGRVWIGTVGNGLLVWDQDHFRHVIEPSQLPQGVRLLLVTRDSRVWFANLSGLYLLEDDKPTRVLETRSNLQFPAALAEGAYGSIWLGTFGGSLMRFADGKWTTFTPGDAVPASRFWALLPEPDDTVWIGTLDQGLLRFRGGRFARVTKRDGLVEDEISHILPDEAQGLWLGTRAGIMHMSRRELEAHADGYDPALSCRIFGRGAGLLTSALTLEFQPSALRAHDGRLWFGTPNGVTWVQPRDLRQPRSAPRATIESATANGRVLELPAPPKPVSAGHNPDAPPLVLGPGLRGLEIRFSAPDFAAPEQLRYKYRLEGLDADWTDAGSRRMVHYPHLPPGTFTFRVAAGNSDGIWDEAGATLRLEIRPYLWERSGFTTGVIALAVGLLSLGVWRVSRRRMRRKLETLARQRELERERARIAQDLHDDLGAGLTEISLTTDLAQSPDLPADESRQYVREIGLRARELVQSMDEIVWAVNPRNDSVMSLAAYICQYAQRLLKAADIRCRLDVQGNLPSVSFNAEQRYQLFLAFKEAITNVARHSHAREMRLSVQAEGETLRIILQDDGCGFDPGNCAAGADGLRNMSDRLARLGGQCAIVSRSGDGARVEFTLPLASPSNTEPY